jgi:hypothetical protein
MGVYYCADGRRIPEGHDPEQCPPCLRAMRDGIKREYHENVNVDLVQRLREMDERVHKQRDELARLNAQVTRPPSPMSAWDAFRAWVAPALERGDRRLASCAYRAGWAAARRAISMPDDEASPDGGPAK